MELFFTCPLLCCLARVLFVFASTFHFVNLTFAYDNTLALFGRSAWITGGFICLTMMVIYSATPENTRRGQFEIFWYSHHCFVLFFLFILFHGKGGINPHYWSQHKRRTWRGSNSKHRQKSIV